jgi:hypothetical protein
MRSTIRSHTSPLLQLASALLVAAAPAARADADHGEPRSKIVSAAQHGRTLMISGEQFGTHRRPLVTLGERELPVVSFGDDAITATLPDVIEPASYWLRVHSFTKRHAKRATLAVTLGAGAASQGPAGPQGPAGGQGAKGLTWRGHWDPAAAYYVDDAVELDGSSFVAIVPNVASPPPGVDWDLLAAAGAPGVQGPQGLVGPMGPMGPAGSTGPAGPAGATGAVGPQGEAGPAGPAGPAGSQGEAGPAGPAGPQGIAGVSVTATALPAGDGPCRYGGTEFSSATGVTYACNGFPGPAGLVTPAQIEQIELWADHAASWKVCYRHTRDGVGAINGGALAAFHAACDAPGAKFFVAKTAAGVLFGGYTSVGWGGACGWRADADAFLFSLTNGSRHGLVNALTANAVYACPSYGPTMGAGPDFYTNLVTATCTPGPTYACRVGVPNSTECRNDLCGGYNPPIVELEVYTEQ